MIQPWTVRALARGLAGFAVFAFIACGRGDRRAAGASDSARQAPAPRLASVASAGPAPGALPQPLDGMTGDQLNALAQRLRFVGGHERRRRCRGSAECRGPSPSRSTRVAIAGVDQEDSLGVTNIPANGVIAARLINRGQAADSMYGTRPGFDYYLVILPSGDSAATWRLEEVTTAAPRQHRSVGSGKLVGCNHPYVRGARADFKTCAQSAADAGHASLIQSVAFRPMQITDESPIWFGCSLGCCTADPPG